MTSQTLGDVAAQTDRELVDSIVAGDAIALAHFVRRFDQLLFRTARSILKDDAEAEDAVQEAFLQAYGALARFRHEAKVSTWLVRIVANIALARLRKGAHRTELLDRRHTATSHVQDHALPEPEESLSQADVRRLLEARIDALPEAYSSVFVLRAVQELSVEEIAEALDIPRATVRSRYSRARSLLRRSLSRELREALGDAYGFAGERCDRMVESVTTAVASLRRSH
jgi:RNA polymerase sigma-70 factor, ECF subfamily